MRRKIATLAVLVIAILATGGVLAARYELQRSAAPPPAPIPTVPVVAGVVSSQDVPIYLRGVGTVIAYNTVLVRSQIQGQITKIAFTEGQTVHADDLLAQIDPRPYQAQVDQVTATRDRDRAQLANAQANLGRYTQLGEKGWATPQLGGDPDGASRAAAERRQSRRGSHRSGQRPARLYQPDLAN